MRIRSTKPEFWRSERIASVDWDARLVLKGLESYVDDNGVGKDDLALIVADVFPRDLTRDPRETLARVADAISALHEAGLIWRYEDDGTNLIYVSWWESIQRVDRPNKPRFRRPDGTSAYGESKIGGSFATPSRDPRDSLATGTGEQGNRGTGEKDTCASADAERESASLDDDFAEWYATYPRKRGKGQAAKAYRAARKKTDAPTLLAAVQQQRPALTARGEEFCPYPATWLNGERWEDESGTSVRESERHLPNARDLEDAPGGMSDEESWQWMMAQRRKRAAQ